MCVECGGSAQFFGFCGSFLMFFRLAAYLNKEGWFGGVVFALATFFLTPAWGGGTAVASDTSPAALQPAALNHTGTFHLRQIDPELTGRGVNIAAVCRSFTYLDGQPQNDYRLNMEHTCFLDSNVGFVDGLAFEPRVSEHSTAIGGILVGRDPNGYHPHLGHFRYEGVVPDARIDIYEFWRFIVNYVFGGKELQAEILTMSVGTAFDDWWVRGIEHIAEADGLIVVAGIGNGSDVFDPVLYPAAGANVIGVGVIDSVKSHELSTNLGVFSLAHPEHSSVGPTSDGRCKPDIVAPGNCLVPDDNSREEYGTTGNWSSFAAPMVAGAAGLLVQKAKSEPDLNLAVSSEGGNCVIKAILMNSATKPPYWHKGAVSKADDHYVSLDYVQGAGMLNAKRAYEQLIAGRARGLDTQAVGWDNNTITIDDRPENVYRISIPTTKQKIITATLVWNRAYEDEYPFKPLTQAVDDLQLELWAVDPNNGDADYLIDYSDSVSNNVEHIHCPADPNYSTYEIVVTFSDVAQTTDAALSQRYGLAWDVHGIDSRDSIWWYDLNYDGKVDSLDFTVLVDNLKKANEGAAEYLLGDINADGVIDINDVIVLMNHMGLKGQVTNDRVVREVSKTIH